MPRIFVAVSPTFCLSTPVTKTCVTSFAFASGATLIVIPSGSGNSTTCEKPTVKLTLFRFFPIRDMASLLPDRADDLAADAALLRVVAGEESLRGGDDRHAEAAEHLGQLVLAGVEAAARLARTSDAVDDRVSRLVVLQVEAEEPDAAVVEHLVVLDVALVLQDARELHFEARGRDVRLLVPRGERVADAGEEVGDGIGRHAHLVPLTTTPCRRRGCTRRGPGCGSR